MALDASNPDRAIWFDSYSEEYNENKECDVYETIFAKQYQKLRPFSGPAIPSMCLLTIKYKDGYPHRVKSRIVVLGNREQRQWTKSQRYSPTLTQTQLRCLVALTIQNKCVLRQGDIKMHSTMGFFLKKKQSSSVLPLGIPSLHLAPIEN